jgi:Bacterial transcriptional activator domain
MLELGRHEELVGELEALVAEHPLRERFRAQFMLALHRSGRQSDALAAYQDARRLLVEQLGIEPGHELKELERAILHQDPALNPPRTVAPAAEGVRRPRPRMLALAAAVVALVTLAMSFLAFRDSDSSARTLEPGSIGRIDPTSNRIASEIPIGATPVLATANGRAVWVATREGTLTRVDPDRQRVVATLILGGEPSGLAAGARGRLGRRRPRAHLRQGRRHAQRCGPTYQPAATRATRRDARSDGACARRRRGVRLGLERPHEDRADRPSDAEDRTHHSARRRKLRNCLRRGRALGGRAASSHTDLTRLESGDPPPRNADRPRSRLRIGLGRVSIRREARPDRAETEAVETISIEGPATAVAVGHGAVWLALASRGAVLRIDPARNEVSARVAVGAAPISLAVSPAGVWVGVS